MNQRGALNISTSLWNSTAEKIEQCPVILTWPPTSCLNGSWPRSPSSPTLLYIPQPYQNIFLSFRSAILFPTLVPSAHATVASIWNILLSLFPQPMSFFQSSDLPSNFSLDLVARLDAYISCANGPAHHCKHYIYHSLLSVCLCHSTVSSARRGTVSVLFTSVPLCLALNSASVKLSMNIFL